MELSAAQKEVQALLDKPCELELCANMSLVDLTLHIGMTGRKEGSGIVERLEKRHKERYIQ